MSLTVANAAGEDASDALRSGHDRVDHLLDILTSNSRQGLERGLEARLDDGPNLKQTSDHPSTSIPHDLEVVVEDAAELPSDSESGQKTQGTLEKLTAPAAAGSGCTGQLQVCRDCFECTDA